MAEREVTFNAIRNVKLNPEKLNQFKLIDDTRMGKDYALFLSTSLFTYIDLKENLTKFKRIKELTDKTLADLSYLVELIVEMKTSDKAFKINPILELYESLLEENWEVVKYERDILNSTDSYTYTHGSNMKICKAIALFLKENVLKKSQTNNYNF